MIEIQHLSKTFHTVDRTVDALHDINLTIYDGDVYGIIGMSGAGKSTLVRCINMLERPTEGTILIDGEDMSLFSPAALRAKRRTITMIFQGFNLLMQRNCLDNVCFPLELAGVRRAEAKARAKELLELVGLPDKALAYPAQLSGGQQQRVAIARALATEPSVLLCDEATSALDPKTTHQILQLIRKINRTLGVTVVVITHQMSVVEEICNRVAILDEGAVVEEGEVSDVFSAPKSSAAKRLVYPDTEKTVALGGGEGGRMLRIVFRGASSASTPTVTQMAIDCNIAANILYASTRTLDGRVYGNMLLGLPDDETVCRAIAYLSGSDGVSVAEVEREAADEISERESEA